MANEYNQKNTKDRGLLKELAVNGGCFGCLFYIVLIFLIICVIYFVLPGIGRLIF